MKKGLDKTSMFLYNKGQPAGCGGASHGGIAQLGERLNGIQEVSGSIPLISTTRTGEVFASPVFFFLCRVSPAASAAEQGGRGSPLPFPVSRRGRRARKRPDRPQSGAAAGILCASVGMGSQRTAGSARHAVRPPSVSSPCASSIPRLSRRTPLKIRPQAAPFFTPLFVARSS